MNNKANIEVVYDTRPRVYVKYTDLREGADKDNCYERVTIGETVIYVNTFNRNSSVINGHPFFDELEQMYNSKKQENV